MGNVILSCFRNDLLYDLDSPTPQRYASNHITSRNNGLNANLHRDSGHIVVDSCKSVFSYNTYALKTIYDVDSPTPQRSVSNHIASSNNCLNANLHRDSGHVAVDLCKSVFDYNTYVPVQKRNVEIEGSISNCASCGCNHDIFPKYGYLGDTMEIVIKHLNKDIADFEQSDFQLMEEDGRHVIKCCGNNKQYLTDPEGTHIRNIFRVTGINVQVMGESYDTEDITYLRLPNCSIDKAEEVFKLIQIFLRGKFYRKLASFYNDRRAHYAKEASNASCARIISIINVIKVGYIEKMNLCHLIAKEHLFYFCNAKRDISEIDLHYMKASLGDEKRRRRLQKEIKDGRVFSEEYGEAETCVKERLQEIEKLPRNERPKALQIIVGAGNHSINNKQIVKPVVEQLLDKRKIEFIPVNKGSILVPIRPFNGIP